MKEQGTMMHSGEMTETLLKSGVIPMLMADASNPSSNKAYMAIGYQ